MAGFGEFGSDFETGSKSEVAEIAEVDHGDGDGVNEFDDVYNELNEGESTFEYAGSTKLPEASEASNDATEPESTNEDTDVQVSNEAEVGEQSGEKYARFENASYEQGQNQYGYEGTCGPTSIANSLNRVTETNNYSENEVLKTAIDNNLCHKGDSPAECGGTTTEQVLDIIEKVKGDDSDIRTEVYEYDDALTVDELAEKVDDPDTVAMVGVDSATLWDERGDVTNSGLFQTAEYSDHWITVDSPTYDEDGEVSGFNVIDSGGGVDYVDRDKFERMYTGDENHTIIDPTVIIVSKENQDC